MFGFGFVTVMEGLTHNFSGMMAARFFLGKFPSCFLGSSEESDLIASRRFRKCNVSRVHLPHLDVSQRLNMTFTLLNDPQQVVQAG